MHFRPAIAPDYEPKMADPRKKWEYPFVPFAVVIVG
jgi:hypothetical protein